MILNLIVQQNNDIFVVMATINPTSDNIFILPIDKKVTSLIIPPKFEYRSKEFLSGKVLALGKNVTQVSLGDEIAYAKDTGWTVEYGKQKMVVIKPKHIIAVV